jgi:protein-disulfide isomerase/uncharacterized membrane protein
MSTNKKNIWIQILAFIGLILAIKLAFIYYSANYDKYALSSFCSINDFIDCDGAAKSKVAQFVGIPLAYWGMFFYIVILFLTVVEKLKNVKIFSFLEVFKNPLAYISTLGSISFLISIVLAGISIYEIKKLCILCFITYFIDLVIALIASEGMFKNIVNGFKTTFCDFIDGFKKYPKTAVILILIACSFLCYSGITLNFVPHVKRAHDILKYKEIKYNPYRVKGNKLGNDNGEVVINLYSDYVCPLCYIQNIMLHKAVKEFTNIKVVHHNYPFDKECNKYIDISMHPNACFMSKGALAAKKQGNYWEMSSLLYENQPQNEKEMLELVTKLGFDKTKFLQDIYSKDVENELNQELASANSLGIDATPTMIINGESIVGVKPYYELKELLIKYGAKRK